MNLEELENEISTYKCIQCRDEWEFFPYDYEDELPTKCPHCEMPVIQMIKDVFKEEGIKGVISQLYKRYVPRTNPLK